MTQYDTQSSWKMTYLARFGDCKKDKHGIFCSLILSPIDLHCHVFPFEILLLKSVFVCKRHFWWRQIWRHLHVTILQCWANFSNVLVGWSIRTMHAKITKLCLNLSKSCLEYCGLCFSDTVCIVKYNKRAILRSPVANYSNLPNYFNVTIKSIT